MLSFLRRKVCPIGIDFGSDSIKLVQLAAENNTVRLVAAAKMTLPEEARSNATQRAQWFVKAIKKTLSSKPFKGRNAVISLPAREMFIEHLRLPVTDREQAKQALMIEAQTRLPFDSQQALIRHIVAGEYYDGTDTKLEVILMAAAQKMVEYYLRIVELARLEIDSVNVEPCALVKGFAHLLADGEQGAQTTMLLDLGHQSTKVMITHGDQVAFTRTITPGAVHFAQALTETLQATPEQATQWCRQLCRQQPAPAPMAVAVSAPASKTTWDEDATTEPPAMATRPDPESVALPLLSQLCEEIRSCMRYHDFMFESTPVNRVIFLGGQAKNMALCKKLAAALGVAAQLGDPIARIAKNSRLGEHSDVEPGQMNGEWAVAFGLSLDSLR